MFAPRFYQDDCLRILQKVRTKGLPVALAVMASGLGKTVTMAFDTLSFRKQFPKARVLYLCHQNHILRQACGTFEAVNGNSCSYGFYHGQEKTAHTVDFLFASLQTMRNYMKRFNPEEFDYVVVDESHHTQGDTYLDVVTYWRPKFLLGMTATPDRTDGQDIRRIFGQEVFSLPLEDALAQGLLTPVDYRLMTDEIQLKNMIKTADRRLSVRMLNRTIFVPKRDEEIVRVIKKHTQEVSEPKIIIFCQSIAHCDQLAKIIPGAMSLHSHISFEERVVRVELLRQGIISTLLVVDVFNEGIDIPEVNVIVFLRVTTSRVVFFQQLGRGLRLSDEKDKVIVLDFVANCERVKTVYTFWDEVQQRRKKVLESRLSSVAQGQKTVPQNVDPFYLNTGIVSFQEKILEIVDVVRRINDGYSREECIQSLLAFAKKLGRSPTQVELHKNTELPSLSMYIRYFGSFTKALLAAGLQANQLLDVSEKDLLEQLVSLKKHLGHTPSQREVAEASGQGRCSCEPIFRKHFGSLTEALKRIGSNPSRYVGLSKKELKAQLRTLYKKLGRVPTVEDLAVASANNEMASYAVFYDRFGSWDYALQVARIINNARTFPRYTEQQLLADLRKAKKILRHTPTITDIQRLCKEKKLKVGSVQPFYTRYKTFGNALKAAWVA